MSYVLRVVPIMVLHGSARQGADEHTDECKEHDQRRRVAPQNNRQRAAIPPRSRCVQLMANGIVLATRVIVVDTEDAPSIPWRELCSGKGAVPALVLGAFAQSHETLGKEWPWARFEHDTIHVDLSLFRERTVARPQQQFHDMRAAGPGYFQVRIAAGLNHPVFVPTRTTGRGAGAPPTGGLQPLLKPGTRPDFHFWVARWSQFPLQNRDFAHHAVPWFIQKTLHVRELLPAWKMLQHRPVSTCKTVQDVVADFLGSAHEGRSEHTACLADHCAAFFQRLLRDGMPSFMAWETTHLMCSTVLEMPPHARWALRHGNDDAFPYDKLLSRARQQAHLHEVPTREYNWNDILQLESRLGVELPVDWRYLLAAGAAHVLLPTANVEEAASLLTMHAPGHDEVAHKAAWDATAAYLAGISPTAQVPTAPRGAIRVHAPGAPDETCWLLCKGEHRGELWRSASSANRPVGPMPAVASGSAAVAGVWDLLRQAPHTMHASGLAHTSWEAEV